ncbi:MAG: hypothetical protein AAB583_01565 [Patescibacteria group bacterium]
MITLLFSFIKKNLIEAILLSFSLAFSFWLMFSTFSHEDGSMIIATKAWSDFASHIPLIRSFSLGHNFPPEYPIFPGEPIRYHFLFYLFVGVLERIGIPLHYALNIPSALLFTSLVFMIYIFSSALFKNKAVGIVSVLLFLFNGSLSFVEFFRIHPFGLNMFTEIINNTSFPSFGPYDGKIVAVFWNLNTYTNQRHLAGAYAFSLALIYFHIKPLLKNTHIQLNRAIILGILLGLSFFFHTAIILMTITILGCLFFISKKLRLSTIIMIGIALIIAFPQYLYLQSASSSFKIGIHPGYLIANNLTIVNFINYWFANLGLHFITIPIAFFLIKWQHKKLFLCFLSLFFVGNLLQFTPDMPTNHKFFNYFIIFGCFLSSYVIIKLWQKSVFIKPVALTLTFLLVFSGIIDFFPIYNDSKIVIDDYRKNPDIAWVKNNTPPESVFLNSIYIFAPESIAGRKILFGWPYFSWGAGYNTLPRDVDRKNMLATNDKASFCTIAQKYGIRYASLKKNQLKDDTGNIINHTFFNNNFPLVYSNTASQIMIYSTNSCYNPQ